MRYLIAILCALCIFVPQALNAHQTGKRGKRRCVVVPNETILLSIASQPNCPLKIEDGKLLISLEDGHLLYEFRLRNRGSKPIHYFTVSACGPGGGPGTLGLAPPWDGRITDELLMPGQVVSEEDDDIEIVPLTDALREKLKLSGPMKAAVVLMVDQVDFADGSKYDDRKALEELRDYFSVLPD